MRRILLILTICILSFICLSAATYAEGDNPCNHEWGEWVYQYTTDCTEGVDRSRECQNCRTVQEETVYEHCWSDWQVDYNATCASTGLKSRYCQTCGAYDDQVIPATGAHKWSSWNIVNGATIYNAGNQVHYCMECGASQWGTLPILSPFASFTQSKYTVYKGSKMQMGSVLSIANGDAVKKWKTSKKSVVSITKSGKIKAKKKGTAKITVTLKSGKKATCTVKVVKKPKASKKKASGGTVYITRTGIRYHYNPNCRGLRNANALFTVSLSEAKNKGLTPCQLCGY